MTMRCRTAPKFQDAGEAESPRFGASGRLFRPPRHPSHPAKAWGLPGAVPRLPPAFRGQDRAASAPLCPLKPGIGRGRPGRSGRVIPGRNPAGSPGFAWGRRVQGLAFPGERPGRSEGKAREIGPAWGIGAPVCPFCVHSPNGERSPFGERGAHPAHGAPRLTAARPKPGASRIHPGFRRQKGRAEAGFCPLKAGGVPGQGPGASRSREAAPGPPRFRRVGKVARGPESEGARGSARRSRGRWGHAISGNFDTWEIQAPKDLDDPARQRKKLWRCWMWMPKNFDARASRRHETLAGEGRKRHETLAPEARVFPGL